MYTHCHTCVYILHTHARMHTVIHTHTHTHTHHKLIQLHHKPNTTQGGGKHTWLDPPVIVPDLHGALTVTPAYKYTDKITETIQYFQCP